MFGRLAKGFRQYRRELMVFLYGFQALGSMEYYKCVEAFPILQFHVETHEKCLETFKTLVPFHAANIKTFSFV